MSDQWRILVVEDEENLNWSIVNSLRKDGYSVQGVMSGAEAMRILWSTECDVVISDLKMPGADGFELLHWVRMHRPKTRLIMVTAFGSPSTRNQALEGGVVSYLEKPFDLHTLKEELRRLLQQTGFSASLDSFDLLDVIQIITMSRKSIALLVNTGLEEHGVLRFQGGELIWAEYGSLRGEEAFFALAAHKNGVVIHQPWNDQITPNVTQPLSRLIFQALQYRTKYATAQQLSSEHEAAGWVSPAQEQPRAQTHGQNEGTQKEEDVDDSPFGYLAESAEGANGQQAGVEKEWWQQTGWIPQVRAAERHRNGVTNTAGGPANIVPSTVRKMPASQHTDLPSWLTDQPTHSIPALRPSSLSNSAEVPVAKPSTAEWQLSPKPPVAKTTEPIVHKQLTGPHLVPATNPPGPPSSPEWQPLEPVSQPLSASGPLKDQVSPKKTDKLPTLDERQESVVPVSTQKTVKRNYPTLVSALQTLGYSIPGFVATAVITMDGQPIAQVAVDDLDISPLYESFSAILQGVLRSLEYVGWGTYEDTVITSVDRHILLRLVGDEREAFHVLITTREADPVESLEVMANVASAIAAALR